MLFQLEPYTCLSCIKKIETALNKTTGVGSAKVLFNLSKIKEEFNIKESWIRADETKAEVEKIKKSEAVLGVVETKGQLQVIHGPGKANKITDEVKKLLGTRVLIGKMLLKKQKQD